MGDRFQSDGRLYGDVSTQQVPCDAAASEPRPLCCMLITLAHGPPLPIDTCQVKVPAPSVAVVFLTAAALKASTPDANSFKYFTSTIGMKMQNTATLDQAVLATSNGRGGTGMNGIRYLGSTSHQSQNPNEAGRKVVPGMIALGVAVLAAALGRMAVR
jgi:hypothetical protein